jgi:beta-glucosidase
MPTSITPSKQEVPVKMLRQLSLIKHSFQSALLLILAFAIAPLTSSQTPASAPPDDAAVHQRADALLKEMTLEEKIGQLSQLFDFAKSKEIDDAVAKGQLGSLLFVTDPAETNRLQHLAVDKTRLHIPLIFGFDVIHGFRTIFPVPIAMAASWDPSVAVKAQTIAAKEARSVGIEWAFEIGRASCRERV